MSDTIHATTSVAPTTPSKNKPEPFLQWVGGKRKIASKLIERIPPNLNNYYEPFLGGGALFFAVKGMFKLEDEKFRRLTGVKLSTFSKMVDILKQTDMTSEHYYKIRSSSDAMIQIRLVRGSFT